MPARKEHRSDKMPSDLERDAKCQMEPLLAGALIHRLSDVDLIRLNGWLDMERRAAADEIWERHKDTIASANDIAYLLVLALPYVEEAEKDPAYKPGVVAKLVKQIRQHVGEKAMQIQQGITT